MNSETDVRNYSIPVHKPYDFKTVLAFLKRHAAYGIEEVKNNTYIRYIPIKNTYGTITVTMTSPDALAITMQGNVNDACVLKKINVLFDADHNPINLPENTGVRAVGCFNPFEISVSIILGQLVSIKQATKKLEQLIIAFGNQIEKSPEQNIYAFPEPKDLMNKEIEKLGVTKIKAGAIRELAKQVDMQKIIFSNQADIKIVEKALLSIKGIGHWTTQLILMRCFQFKDAFPKNDLFIQKAIENSSIKTSKWGNYRAYLTHFLWNKSYSDNQKTIKSIAMSNDKAICSNISFYSDTQTQMHVNKDSLVMTRLKSPFGDLLAGATLKGICLLEFTDTNRIEMQLSRLKKDTSLNIINGESPFFTLLNQQLQAYFLGTLKHFDVPLDIKGTEFQQQVWRALQAIPYGETRSYQAQAIAMNNPKAIRAVANANRNNKISILIPCHRVIGKNGTMTGYGGGIWRKEFLLNLELNK